MRFASCNVLAALAVSTGFLLSGAIDSSAVAQNRNEILRGITGGGVLGIIVDEAAKAEERRRREEQSRSRQQAPASAQPFADERAVEERQRALVEAGYDVGGVDGVWGPKSRTATKQIQAMIAHPQTGWLTGTQLRWVQNGGIQKRLAAPPIDPAASNVDDETQTIRMQAALARAGYQSGEIDGRWGNDARAAAADFQRRIGETVTGRLSEAQLLRIEGRSSQQGTVPRYELAQARGQVQPATDKVVLGEWKGTYTCQQGLTGVTVQFDAPGDPSGSARFEFYTAPGGPRVPNGIILYQYSFDPASRQLELRSGRWIKRPATFNSIDISGHLTPDLIRFNGRVLNPACSQITLARSAPAGIANGHTAAPPAPRAAEAGPTWIGSGHDSVLMQLASGTYCAPPVKLRVTARNDGFFAHSQAAIERLSPELLRRARSVCPQEAHFVVEGFIEKRLDYRGEWTRENGWRLVHLDTPLTLATQEVDAFKFSSGPSDLKLLDEMMSGNVSRLGGTDVPELDALRKRASQRKIELLQLYAASFEKQLSELPGTAVGLKDAQRLVKRELSLVEQHAPETVALYQRMADARMARMGSEIEAALDKELSSRPKSWEHAAAASRAIRRYITDLAGEAPVVEKALRSRLDVLQDSTAEQLASFKNQLESYEATWATLDKLKAHREMLSGALDEIAAFPQYLQAVKERRETLLSSLERQTVHLIERDAKSAQSPLPIIDAGKQQAGRFQSEGQETASSAILQATSRALKDFLPNYRQQLAAYEPSWLSVKSLNTIKLDIVPHLKDFPELQGFLENIDEQRLRVLAELEAVAIKRISAHGSTAGDLEAVVDLGRQVEAPFASEAALQSMQAIQAATTKRITEIVENELPNFKNQLAALPISLDALIEAQSLIEEYGALAGDVPAFGAYREASVVRAAEIDHQLCDQELKKAGANTALADRPILVGERTTSFRHFACQASRAGSSVSVIPGSWLSSWFSSSVIVAMKTRDGDAGTWIIAPAERQELAKALVGISRKDEKGEEAITLEAWKVMSEELVRPPVSGKPDGSGLTTCDRLASHPDDPHKLGGGVADDALDIEKALEACVAAVEHRPDEARQIYQLARALLLAGDESASQQYLMKAAEIGYAAAHADLGDIYFADENAADKALQQFKLAQQQGHKGVGARIELLGAPPIPDLPPELAPPTEADILSTLPRNQCHSALGAQMCITITAATIKDCAQISDTDVSCEWRPTVRCETNAGAFHNALIASACNSTEFAFSTFRKRGDGTWQKID
jgi:peptidoglycan hydrolase-like protein with peptidoglycan-binding domain